MNATASPYPMNRMGGDLRQQLLQIALIVDALTFLTAAAMNFGAHIPLGFTTLQFAPRVIPAGAGEALIGAALLLAAITRSRSWSWIGFWLSAGGIAFGLVATSGSRGAAFEVHLVMLMLAIILLALLVWTMSGPRPEGEIGARCLSSGSSVIGGLMLIAAMTLLGASVIHFGVTAPLLTDPFAAAAIPEAILGGVLLIGGAVLVTRQPGAWEIAVASTVLTILLTLYGFSITLRSGRTGDIVYHASLLAMLLASLALLLSPSSRRARGRD